ncbi:hypothetical protein JXD38_03800 [candidate division WOR-3 bacterium]|nr:hypothetical protein [candidate division WOR-3 bacterium]
MEASAGEDQTLRRWRITVTVAAWLLIAQSALAILSGLAGIMLAPLADPGVMLGQLGPYVDRSSAAAFGTLMRQAALLNRIQTVGSLVLLAGSIGLLLRKKWGWYTVIVVHVAAAAAVFIWMMPMFENLYRALDPRSAGTMALAMSVLAALAPAVVVAFLLLRPVVSQFQEQGSRIPGV